MGAARRRGRPPARFLVLLLLLLTLAGCAADTPPTPSPRQRQATARAWKQELLERRAQAVRDHDEHAFLATVDHSAPGLLRRQRRLFDNLVQLPLKRFGYRLVPGTGQTQVVMQLGGFDARPVRVPAALRLARVHGRMVVVGARPGPDPRPWDLTRVHVARRRGVLGVFDAAMWPHAGAVMRAVASGRRQVAAAVPFTWNDHVVVYCFADHRVLATFRDVPGGGSITHLGAMTFPVYATPSGNRVAAMRFTVLPSSVRAGEPFLGRIVRHELAHVAIGDRDNGDPVWMSEGIAEYVGARPVPAAQRRIPRVAVDRARAGASSLPASRDFNSADQDWHYALSWMACDYIATHQGESTMWQLMTALHAGGRGTPDARQDAVLRRVLGYDSHELARRAAARILAIYG